MERTYNDNYNSMPVWNKPLTVPDTYTSASDVGGNCNYWYGVDLYEASIGEVVFANGKIVDFTGFTFSDRDELLGNITSIELTGGSIRINIPR